MLRSSTPVAPPKPRQNKLTQQRPSTVQKLETQDLISGLVWKQSSISSSRNANNGANSNRNVDLRWNAPKPKDVKVERFSERSSPTHNSNIPTSANNHTTSSYQSYPYPYQYQQQSQQSFTPFPITSSTPLPNASSAHEETYYPIPPSEYYYEPSFTYANNTLNTNACACASCQYPQMEAYAHPAHPDPNDLIRSMTSLSIHNGNAVTDAEIAAKISESYQQSKLEKAQSFQESLRKRLHEQSLKKRQVLEKVLADGQAEIKKMEKIVDRSGFATKSSPLKTKPSMTTSHSISQQPTDPAFERDLKSFYRDGQIEEIRRHHSKIAFKTIRRKFFDRERDYIRQVASTKSEKEKEKEQLDQILSLSKSITIPTASSATAITTTAKPQQQQQPPSSPTTKKDRHPNGHKLSTRDYQNTRFHAIPFLTVQEILGLPDPCPATDLAPTPSPPPEIESIVKETRFDHDPDVVIQEVDVPETFIPVSEVAVVRNVVEETKPTPLVERSKSHELLIMQNLTTAAERDARDAKHAKPVVKTKRKVVKKITTSKKSKSALEAELLPTATSPTKRKSQSPTKQKQATPKPRKLKRKTAGSSHAKETNPVIPPLTKRQLKNYTLIDYSKDDKIESMQNSSQKRHDLGNPMFTVKYKKPGVKENVDVRIIDEVVEDEEVFGKGRSMTIATSAGLVDVSVPLYSSENLNDDWE